MHFMLSSMSVVYVLFTPMPDDGGENPTMKQVRKRANFTPTDEEFEASEPLDTRITSSHSTASSNFTTPLSPGHPLTQTSPNPMISQTLYYYRNRYKSSYKTPSPSSLASSSTLLLWKRYQGTSKLIEDTEGESSKSYSEREGSVDEGPDSEEEEEAALEGYPYSLPVLPSSLTVSTLVASPSDSSPVASPTTVEAESLLTELGAQNTMMQQELQELRDRVTTLEWEGSRRGR
nr:hypothetical protein [Tanacetum cinerariifolium]